MSSEELVTGEVVEAAPAHARQLSPQQLQAATVESAGGDRKMVARAAGVAESSIKTWRQQPEYRAEIERLKAVSHEMMSQPVRQLQEEVVEGMRDAVRTLRNALEANDRRGNPAYTTRQAAAKTLLEFGTELAKPRNDDAQAAAASGVVNLAVQVNTSPSGDE